MGATCSKAGLQDRVMAHVFPEPNTGCRLWGGPKAAAGYGQYGGGTFTRSRLAHRVVYELLVGPIPDEKFLDHICRNRICVNPVHLRPVTPRENALENSISPSACNALKTSCPSCGTSYASTRDGFRRCMSCNKEWRWRNSERVNEARNQRRRDRIALGLPRDRCSHGS